MDGMTYLVTVDDDKAKTVEVREYVARSSMVHYLGAKFCENRPYRKAFAYFGHTATIGWYEYKPRKKDDRSIISRWKICNVDKLPPAALFAAHL